MVSDFLKEGAGTRGLAQLHYRRHRISLLQLLSPDEVYPEREISPGEWEFLDPEPETPDPEQHMVRLDLGHSAFSRYRETLAEHNAELRAFAKSTGALYVSAETSLPMISYFSETLRQAGLLVG